MRPASAAAMIRPHAPDNRSSIGYSSIGSPGFRVASRTRSIHRITTALEARATRIQIGRQPCLLLLRRCLVGLRGRRAIPVALDDATDDRALRCRVADIIAA